MPPTLALLAPLSGGCVEVAQGPDPRVPIQLAVQNIQLRPQGTCFFIESCGHVELWVNGRLNNASNGSTIDLLLRNFADREARFDVEVRVVDDEGAPVLGPPAAGEEKGPPLVAALSFETRASCGEGTGGGGGSTTSTSTSSSTGTGTGGQGGAGGAGGQGGASGACGTGGTGGPGGQGGTGGAGGQGGTGSTGGAGGLGGAGGAGGI